MEARIGVLGHLNAGCPDEQSHVYQEHEEEYPSSLNQEPQFVDNFLLWMVVQIQHYLYVFEPEHGVQEKKKAELDYHLLNAVDECHVVVDHKRNCHQWVQRHQTYK